MRTKITLGSSGVIDLFEDIPLSLNYSVADIKKPEARNGSYSKTITIPGSKINDLLFARIFEIDIDCRYDVNIKAPCSIYIDELEQLSGFLRLVKIIRTDDNKIEYECTITGNVSNMFSVLGDAELTALSFSEFNHTYNKTNQKASWSATPGSGYVYPMIDYGYTDDTTFDVTNFYPAIYVKTYIDKIFQYAGFTYSSDFFNSALFKRLIIPLNSNTFLLTDAQITPRLFSATIATPYNFVEPAPFKQLQADNEVLDPSSAYNPSTWIWNVPKTGYYNLFASAEMKSSGGSGLGSVAIRIYNGGSMSLGGSYTTIASGAPNAITTSFQTYSAQCSAVYLTAGQQVLSHVVAGVTTGQTIFVNSGSFYNSVANIGVVDGEDVDLNAAIPQKIKQKDFLMSLVKMFNLYIETDKDYANKLYIEPRNNFYALGKTIDWTDKLDISQPLEIIPMGDLDSKKYIFSYTQDKDYYNELYFKSWNEVYGTKTLTIANEFVQGNKETKIIFSPTPLVNNGDSDRTIPEIFSTDSAGNITPKQSNIRILYYGGEIATAFPWTYTGLISGTTTEVTYPYAGHLDSVTSPTIDLSFGVPNEVYYTALSYTNNNLYNAYYKQFIEEITDPNSKIITGYFYLTPYDILKLDFRNQFYVDGYFLRLNKVTDYNPVVQGLTKCEFIKIKTANTFVPSIRTIYGGVAGFFSGSTDPAPLSGGKSKAGNSYIGAMRTYGNYVSENSNGVIVTGTRNFVGAGARNILISNSSGCVVAPGVIGATIINSSGVIVEENGLTYINGTRMPAGIYKVYKANISQVGVSAPTDAVFDNTLSASITWAYSAVGTYTGTLTGEFTNKKTWIIIQSVLSSAIISATWTDVNTITILTKNLAGALTDVKLADTSIEIRVYQ